jgi:urease, beta subunit
MNSTDLEMSQKQNAFETPQEGIYQEMPSVTYPNTPGFMPKQPCSVGGVILADTPITYNTNRFTKKITVRNTGDRPIQVGSHFHFFEVNRYLEFDRDMAFGYHLNIPATTAIRFEPGDQKQVEIVTYGGKRRVMGFNGLVMGYTGGEDSPTYFPNRIKSIARMNKLGFKNTPEKNMEMEYANTADKQEKQ